MSKITKPIREDYAEIADLVNESEKIYFTIYTKEELEQISICNESVESLIESENRQKYLIIRDNEEIVAFASFRLKNEEVVWVSSLFVKPNKQKKNYGSALLKEIELSAKDIDAKVVALETSEKATWAVNFYLKNNYKILKVEDMQNPPFTKILEKPPVEGRHVFVKEL